MRRMRLTLTLLAVAALTTSAGCVASGGSAPSAGRSPGSPGVFDPCPSVPADVPSAKAQSMSEVCAPNTLPPNIGTPVPWLDAPYSGPEITASPTIDIAGSYPKCDPAQVEPAFEGWGSGDDLGTVAWIVARTTGSKPCVLEGLARIDLLDGSGAVLTTGTEGDGPYGPALLQPNLPPPSAAPSPGAFGPKLLPGYGYEEFRIAGFCGTAVPAAIAVVLPGRDSVRIPLPALPPTRCPSAMGDALLDWRFVSAQAPQPTVVSAALLDVTPVLPSQAVVGRPLEFTIALKDRLDVPVSLDPCPIYTIQVAVLDSAGKEDGEFKPEYTLNCGSVKTIEPGQTIAFAMKWDVPANLPVADSMVLWWWIGTSNNPQAMQVKQPILLAGAGN